MTKKDYELIAKGFKDALSTWTPDTQERKSCIYAIQDACKTVATKLEEQNPRFNKTKFLQACGIED